MLSFRKQDRDAAILFLCIIVLVVLLFPLLKEEGDNLNSPLSMQRGAGGESFPLRPQHRRQHTAAASWTETLAGAQYI